MLKCHKAKNEKNMMPKRREVEKGKDLTIPS
jgi:hypothetical protein